MQSRPQFQPLSALPHILLYHRTVRKILFFLSFFLFFLFSKNAHRDCASAASCCVYVPHQKDRLFSPPDRLCGFSTFESGGRGGRHLPPHFFFFFFSFFVMAIANLSVIPLRLHFPPLWYTPQNYSEGMKPGLLSSAQCPGASPCS